MIEDVVRYANDWMKRMGHQEFTNPFVYAQTFQSFGDWLVLRDLHGNKLQHTEYAIVEPWVMGTARVYNGQSVHFWLVSRYEILDTSGFVVGEK